jgi:chromosome segregation ATPase
MMASDTQSTTLNELIDWIETQLRTLGNEQNESFVQIDQLRRQIVGLAEQVADAERKVREVDPKLNPLKGVPDKLRAIEEDTEHIRQRLEASRTEFENNVRVLRAEVEYERQELGDVIRKSNQAADQIGLVAADAAQMQSQVGQVSHTLQTLLERQREVEAAVEQFGLRLERQIEVNRDVEERLRAEWQAYEDERIGVVLERMNVVGEMVKRNEELIEEVAQEQTLREDVMQEIAVWRDQHKRIDERLAVLESTSEEVLAEIDRLHGQAALIEGRHSGLGERVAGMRREIAEVVDHVREEFNKYNQMMEKQRRKQIQALEQELRETRFHAFRPPEEP